ncbi:MAG: GNAT family N-acetyltransferase [Ruminococcus sp.]|nr:GNAT family N-acetyltransferase [Ruminococcus sp.]
MSALFTTKRLTIRKFAAEDFEDLAEILTDKEVTYFEPYETFTKEACVQEAINFSNSDEFFAVVLDNKVIGKIYFSDRKYGCYEIGYTFNGSYQGKGYACESVKGMMEYAFSELSVRRIIAQINTRNTKSVKLAERLGMRKEAEHKEIYPSKENENVYEDFYIYALLKKEFSEKTK